MVGSDEVRLMQKEVSLEILLQNLTAATEKSDRTISYDRRPTHDSLKHYLLSTKQDQPQYMTNCSFR